MRIYNCKKYVLQDIAMEKDTITRCLPTKETYLQPFILVTREENPALNQKTKQTAYFIPFHWSHNGLKSLMKLHWFYENF